MSLIPLMFDFNPCSHYNRPSLDHGRRVYPEQIRSLLDIPRLRLITRPSLHVHGKDGFQVSTNVKEFQPNEISVRVVNDTIIVEGKHKEREDDHGYISREFIRQYMLPKGYNSKDVVATLSSDGILMIKASPSSEEKIERIVQIQQTDPVQSSTKENLKRNKRGIF